MAPEMALARFISVEGGEGVGKSTQVARLAEALTARGLDVITTREPGGTPGAEAIRALLLEGAAERWGAAAERLLFAAARADHVARVIAPALASGRWVISDRFVDSSLAYQGLGSAESTAQIRTLHRIGSGGLMPHRTLLLDADEAVVAARLAARDPLGTDRIGGRDAAFHARVRDAFRAIAAEEPIRVRTVPADGSVEDVRAAILHALADIMPA